MVHTMVYVYAYTYVYIHLIKCVHNKHRMQYILYESKCSYKYLYAYTVYTYVCTYTGDGVG